MFKGLLRYGCLTQRSCIAISGLASHPFGSWRPKDDNSPWMWIRDALPKAFPNTRVALYGYDTTLVKSNSFQTIADLAFFLGESLKASGFASKKPVLFLAHSLGGLVLKEALDRERQMLRRVAGAILFGVPSRGMETQALMTVVRGQANEAIVRDLTAGSDYLQSLDDRFSDVASQGRMKLFWAYETRTSPTVAVSRLLSTEGELTNIGTRRWIVCQDRAGGNPRDAAVGHAGTVWNSLSIHSVYLSCQRKPLGHG